MASLKILCSSASHNFLKEITKKKKKKIRKGENNKTFHGPLKIFKNI